MSTEEEDADGRAPGPPSSGEESLNQALSDLERMLESRGRGRQGDVPETDTSEASQYDIPLLDDVVVAGGAPELPALDEPPRALSDDPELVRRMAERLASEVEVIVNTRIESALQEAADAVQAEIRKHLDIVLPEILDELLRTPPHED